MNSILFYNENDTKNDSVLNHINFGKDYSDELDRIFVAINKDQKTIFQKVCEKLDANIYFKLSQHPNISIISKRARTIKTTTGIFTFKRRYYFDDVTGNYFYPLDIFLGLDKRKIYTNDVRIVALKNASESVYRIAGRSISESFTVSKSTVCRIVKTTKVEVCSLSEISKNDAKIHVQIDEKYVNVIGSESKLRLYTATIFKGIYKPKNNENKHILLNKTVLSADKLKKLIRKINHLLKDKYKVQQDDEIWVSGDAASYIVNFKNKITVCKATYVADKFHVFKLMKDAFGIIPKSEDFTDEFIKSTAAKIDEIKDDILKKTVKKLFVVHPDSLKHYNDPTYLGCSQEGMNSHIYAARFAKLGNKFKMKTIIKLALIKEAEISNSKIRIVTNYTPQEENYLTPREYCEIGTYYINLNEYHEETRKMFHKIMYGVWWLKSSLPTIMKRYQFYKLLSYKNY